MKYAKGWKVMDDKGREYSNNPLPLRRAKAQMRALYANAYHGSGFTSYTDDDGHHMLIHGNGFITDIFAKAKKATFGAVRSVLSKAANVIGRPIRNNYPPAARHMLAKYAKATVDNVIIRREPIASLINTALNFISLGKWNEVRAKLNFDKLFHLSMVVQLRNPNAYLVVEKNEVINISDKFKMRSDRMEYITVPVPCCVNFWDFMRKAQEAKGDSFFQYDAFTNNCQMFIDGILNANGINTPEVQKFVLQDVTNLLSDLPEYIQPFARLTTNIAGVADTILQGQGADCCGSCSIRGGGDCGQRNGCGMCGSSNGEMVGGKIYCGDKVKRKLPPGVENGTTFECFRKGVGVGMMLEQNKIPTEAELPKMTIRKLAELARRYQVPRYGVMTKEELINAIKLQMKRKIKPQPLQTTGGGKNDICMPRKDYMEEHRNLIALLERISNGSRFEATKQRKEMKGRAVKDTPATIDTFFKVKGGRLSAEEKARLLAAREDYAKDMRENPQKYKATSYDPSEGGTKEPCNVYMALDTKEGGLTRRPQSLGYKPPSECAFIQKVQSDESRRRQYDNMSGFQKFSQGFLDIVTPIADVASNIIPGVSGQIYQQFAPPGSAYYSGNGKRKLKGGMPTWAIAARAPRTAEQKLELEKYHNPYYGEPMVECPTIPEVKARDGAVIMRGMPAKTTEKGRCEAGIRGYESAMKTKDWRDNNLGFSGFVKGFTNVVQPVMDVASFLPVVGSVARGISSGIDAANTLTDMAYGDGKKRRKKIKGGAEEEAAFEESLQAAAAAPQPAYVPPAEESEGEDPSVRVPRGNTTRKFATALERLLFDYLGEVAADNMEGFTRETLPALLNEDLPLAVRNKVIRDFINQLVEADVDKTKLSEGLAYIKRKRPAYGNAFDIYIKRYRARNPDSTDSEGFASAEGEGKPKLINQLRKAGFTADEYLKKARANARKAGYDPKKLKLAYDGVHKLSMTDNDGKESLFGRAGYGDFIIWSKVKGAEFANKKRDTFIKSHSKIKGDWRADNYSPNNLALRILWAEKYPPGK